MTIPRARAIALVALLGAAMVTATYLQGALAVLSRFVIADLGITRTQLGLAFAAFSLTGAVASPVMGVLTDRGSRTVMGALFLLGGVAVVVAAFAPNFAVLLAAAVVGGWSLGAGNPVTNRVISERISAARWGVVIGLKQAGPPLGLLVAGVVLPPLALLIGWRWALALSVLLPAAGLAATYFLIPGGGGGAAVPGSDRPGETRRVVLWLTVIGFGVATGVSAVIAFLPLYAQEEVGLSATQAGALAACMGLAGVAGRILWGSFGGRFARPSTALLIISWVSLPATLAVGIAGMLGPPALWAGALGLGGSMLAWHAVAWLVIIDRVGTAGVGRASGTMQVGNSIGFGAGPPAVGLLVDLTGDYHLAWTSVGVVFALVTVLTIWVRWSSARRRSGVAGGRE